MNFRNLFYLNPKTKASPPARKKAIVVLSGGADSTICLSVAKYHGYEIEAVTFDYGQRHDREVIAALRIAQLSGVYHSLIELGKNELLSNSPLTSDSKLTQYADGSLPTHGIENTFVAMRNQLFLTIAANRAAFFDASVIFTGVCQADSGGYPDCRRAFIDSLEKTTNLSLEGRHKIKFITPLMDMTKSESVMLALRLQKLGYGTYGHLAYSHTAYDGNLMPTGKDHASVLRAQGFENANVPDPLVLRLHVRHGLPLPETSNYALDNIPQYLEMIDVNRFDDIDPTEAEEC